MKARPTKVRGEVMLEITRRDEALMEASSHTEAISPFKLKTILVPIDFSDCSKKALRYALPLAQTHGAKITLAYAVPPAYGAGEFIAVDYAQMDEDMRITGQRELDKLVADEVHGQAPTDTMVTIGSPAYVIPEAAKKTQADLIVISTHGRTGLKHVFLGSVAEQVVQRAPCPVLVVREHEHEILAR